MRIRRRQSVDAGGAVPARGDGADRTDATAQHDPPTAEARGTVAPGRSPLEDPGFVAGLRAVPTGREDSPVDWPATDVSGVGPDGAPVSVSLDDRSRPLLLVFLSTDCDGCDVFWRGVRDGPPEDVDVVVVTKGPTVVPDSDVGDLAQGTDTPVVRSDRAWDDYRVTGYPFLVLVDPSTRRIVRESVGFAWSDVAALIGGPAGT